MTSTFEGVIQEKTGAQTNIKGSNSTENLQNVAEIEIDSNSLVTLASLQHH